jgi:hypothetical protein
MEALAACASARYIILFQRSKNGVLGRKNREKRDASLCSE